MLQFIVAIAIVAVAALVSEAVRRRRRVDAPTQQRHQLPSQLDRGDFVRPEAPWLIAVFTSDTCSTCADVVRKARVLECDEVAVEVVSYQLHRDRHDRYAIDAVPGLVIAGADGAVAASFLGPITATDLWAAVAEVRDPGSVRSDGSPCQRLEGRHDGSS
jgi:hypothetical protein